MPKPDHARPSGPRAERAELVRLVRRIQALTLELQEPRRRELDHADVKAKERAATKRARNLTPWGKHLARGQAVEEHGAGRAEDH